MLTVKEASALTGVSIRTLHHYDRIGLLPPAAVSDAGYRLYDEACLARLQLIMLYRTLEFPLKDIRDIMDSPDFERNRALDQQIKLLEMKRAHFDNLILLAKSLRVFGMDMNNLSFEAFDTTKIDQYAAEARNSWGNTEAWQAYEQKRKGRSPEQEKALGEGMMALMAEFGAVKNQGPDSPAARAMVERLRTYITEHFYPCTDDILLSLAAMYAGGGSMTENIDAAGGPGTGAFIAGAIRSRLGR